MLFSFLTNSLIQIISSIKQRVFTIDKSVYFIAFHVVQRKLICCAISFFCIDNFNWVVIVFLICQILFSIGCISVVDCFVIFHHFAFENCLSGKNAWKFIVSDGDTTTGPDIKIIWRTTKTKENSITKSFITLFACKVCEKLL